MNKMSVRELHRVGRRRRWVTKVEASKVQKRSREVENRRG